MKKIVIWILTAAIFFGGGFGTCKYLDSRVSETEYDFSLISEEIVEISELSTVQTTYRAEVPYKGEARKIFKHDIPFTDKSMTLKYEGIIKAGPDMKGFAKDDLKYNKATNTVTAKINHSRILSHEINEDSWMICDKNNGLFNALTPEDDADSRKYAKKQALEKVDVETLLREADEKAIDQIEKLLKTTCPDAEIVVKVKK